MYVDFQAKINELWRGESGRRESKQRYQAGKVSIGARNVVLIPPVHSDAWNTNFTVQTTTYPEKNNAGSVVAPGIPRR